MPLRGFEYDGEGREFNVGNNEAVRGRGRSKRVSQMQYFSFMLHPRATGQHLFFAGRLLQEYIVDAWTCMEQNRHQFLSSDQIDLRCELYSGVMDAINEADHDAAQIGRKMVLPSSFSGSNRQISQMY